MSCDRYQRLISDRLDGALPSKKERKLNAHLEACSTCRAFLQGAADVLRQAKALPVVSVPEAYWSDSLKRLRVKLAARESPPARRILPAWGWKWAWLAAPLLLVAFGALFLFRQPGRQALEDFLNEEERIGSIYSELGESPDLEQAFSQALEASLQEDMNAGGDVREQHLENPLLYRVVTEEEMSFLIQELKKGMKT